MPDMSKLEELTKTHHLVGFEMDIGYDFTRGNLSMPEASIKAFWEPQNRAQVENHCNLLVDLKRAIGMYDCTLEHIV